MELWVRNQNKESLTKVSNISLKEIRKPYTNEFGYYGIGTYYDNLQILGKYTTKERALEVLDEIENILKPTIINETIQVGGDIKNGMQDLVLKTKEVSQIEEFSTYVYQMPKD